VTPNTIARPQGPPLFALVTASRGWYLATGLVAWACWLILRGACAAGLGLLLIGCTLGCAALIALVRGLKR
jgi:hypothetical protein